MVNKSQISLQDHLTRLLLRLQNPGQLSVLVADLYLQAIVFVGKIEGKLLDRVLVNPVLAQVLHYLIHGYEQLCPLRDFVDDLIFHPHVVTPVRPEQGTMRAYALPVLYVDYVERLLVLLALGTLWEQG